MNLTITNQMNEKQTQLHPIPAVRAIIENSHGQILLLRRANTKSGHGGWCLPGGKIDYGQTIEEALAAEIQEELSMQLVGAKFFFYQNSLPTEPGEMHYINFYFHCSIEGDFRLNDESSDFAWIGLSDLQNYDIVFKNDEAIHRHFAERTLTLLSLPEKEDNHA